jgi:hypothetical protein
VKRGARLGDKKEWELRNRVKGPSSSHPYMITGLDMEGISTCGGIIAFPTLPNSLLFDVEWAPHRPMFSDAPWCSVGLVLPIMSLGCEQSD